MNKNNLFQSAIIAGVGSAILISILSLLTYETTLGLFLSASFGSTMVLLFGYPESPFAQPKNIFFGHLLTASVGVLFVNIFPFSFITLGLAVGTGVTLMILLNITHPPAGGNPIIVMIGSVSFEYILFPMIFGTILILLIGILINRFILKKNYPNSWKKIK